MKLIIIFFTLISALFAYKNETVQNRPAPIFKSDILWFDLYKAQIEHSYYKIDNDRAIELANKSTPLPMFIRSGQPVTDALNQLVKEKILISGKITLTKNYTKKQHQSFAKLRESIIKKYGSVGAEMLGCGYIKTSEIKDTEEQNTLYYKIPNEYHSILRRIEADKNLAEIIYPDTKVDDSSTPQELWIAYLNSYSELAPNYFHPRKEIQPAYLVRQSLMVKTQLLITKNYPFNYYQLTPLQKLKFDEIQAPLTRKFGWSLANEMLGMGVTSYLNRGYLRNKAPKTTIHLPKSEFKKADKILTELLTPNSIK